MEVRKYPNSVLKDISKTYLLGISDTIGTILLYNDKYHERPRDLMSGARLETMAIQYIEDPEGIKKVIDENRI